MFDFITVVGSIIDAIVSEFTVRSTFSLFSPTKINIFKRTHLFICFQFHLKADNQQKVNSISNINYRLQFEMKRKLCLTNVSIGLEYILIDEFL